MSNYFKKNIIDVITNPCHVWTNNPLIGFVWPVASNALNKDLFISPSASESNACNCWAIISKTDDHSHFGIRMQNICFNVHISNEQPPVFRVGLNYDCTNMTASVYFEILLQAGCYYMENTGNGLGVFTHFFVCFGAFLGAGCARETPRQTQSRLAAVIIAGVLFPPNPDLWQHD